MAALTPRRPWQRPAAPASAAGARGQRCASGSVRVPQGAAGPAAGGARGAGVGAQQAPEPWQPSLVRRRWGSLPAPAVAPGREQRDCGAKRAPCGDALAGVKSRKSQGQPWHHGSPSHCRSPRLRHSIHTAPYLLGLSAPGCSWARRVRMAWSEGCRRGPPDVGAVVTLSSPSSTAPSFGCCPRKACRLSPSDGQPSLWLHGCPSSRDVRAPAGTEEAASGPIQPCQPPALHRRQAPNPGGCGISLSVLTEELDGRVPHGPARRAQAPQRQGHHGCGVAQHGPAQPRPADQRLQHVEGTHLGRAHGAQRTMSGGGSCYRVRGRAWEKTGDPRGRQLPGCRAGQHDRGCGFLLI